MGNELEIFLVYFLPSIMFCSIFALFKLREILNGQKENQSVRDTIKEYQESVNLINDDIQRLKKENKKFLKDNSPH